MIPCTCTYIYLRFSLYRAEFSVEGGERVVTPTSSEGVAIENFKYPQHLLYTGTYMYIYIHLYM